MYWEFAEREPMQAALLDGRWKAHRAGSVREPIVLYDLANDIAEKDNVAGNHPHIVARAREFLDRARVPSLDWPLFTEDR